MKELISDILKNFNSIDLENIEKNYNYLNRIDFKYLININNLPSLLIELQNKYKILEINNTRVFTYENIYFDTPDLKMYLAHHNGKTLRHKIRIRNYVESSLKYLEIKQKMYNSRCLKHRLKLNDLNNDDIIKNFIEIHSPFKKDELNVSLTNKFKRITLVNEEFFHRLTIDFNLIFKNDSLEYLPYIAILEIKIPKRSTSFNKELFKKFSLKQCNFSKYCIGKALTTINIKKNNFKEILYSINRIKI